MIVINNLVKRFNPNDSKPVLNNVSLEIPNGTIFGIVGKSGAGKSTLLRCINLLERPDSGEILIDNIDILKLKNKDLRFLRKKIGVIFQHFNLLNNLTVYENIILPLKLQNTPKKEINSKLEKILNITDLKSKLNAYPKELSGGQKQRVAIARALINDPSFLLCDEATSALDPENTDLILRLLKRINFELKVTIVLITHEMEVIKKICDNAAIMFAGDIVETAPIIKLYTSPEHPYTKELFKISHCEKIVTLLAKELSDSPSLTQQDPLIMLNFLHAFSYMDPFITKAARKLNIDINIIQGNISMIQDQVVGELKVILKNTDINTLNDFLIEAKNSGVNAQVLGYL